MAAEPAHPCVLFIQDILNYFFLLIDAVTLSCEIAGHKSIGKYAFRSPLEEVN